MARGVDVRTKGVDDGGGGVVRIREAERQRLLSVLRVCMAAVEAATRLPAATAAYARARTLRKTVGGGGGDGGGGPGRCHRGGGGGGGGGDGGGRGDYDAGFGHNSRATLVAERNAIIRTLEMASSLLQDVVPDKEGPPSPPPPSLSTCTQGGGKNYHHLNPDTQRRTLTPRVNYSPRNTSATDRFGSTYRREEWKDNNYQHLFSPSRLKKLIKDDQIITSKQRPIVRSVSARKTNNFRKNPEIENRENKVIKEVSIVPSRRVDSENKQFCLKGREKTFLVPQSSKSKIPPSRPPACLNPRHASAHPRLTGRSSPKLWGTDAHGRKKPTAKGVGSRIPMCTSTTPSQTSSCSSKSAGIRNRRPNFSSAPTHRTWSQPLPKSSKPTSQFLPVKSSISKSNHSQQHQRVNKTLRTDIRVHKEATGDGMGLKKSLTMLTFDVPGKRRSRTDTTKLDTLKKTVSENKWFTKKKVKRERSTNNIKRNIRSANESCLKLSREKTFDIPKTGRNK